MLADLLISWEWMLGSLLAIIAAAVKFYYSGREKGRSENIRVDPPFPEVPFKKVIVPPTWDQHRNLEKKVEHLETRVDHIENKLSGQYKEILEAGHERELRLLTGLSELIRQEVGKVHDRVNELLKIERRHNTK